MNRERTMWFFGGVLLGATAAYILNLMIVRASNKKDKPVEKMPEESEWEPLEEAPVEEWREKEEVNYSEMIDKFYNHDPDTAGVAHYTPYRISEEDYYDESYEDYGREVMTYYADGVLTDDADYIIDDPNGLVGDALSIFETEDVDVIYVRDDSDNVQYEIDRDIRKYVEVVGPLPESEDDE